MPFEDLKTSIYLLLDEMTEQPEDLHQLQEQLREKISEFRTLGLPVPEDFLQAERDLRQDLNPPKT
ncbi:MAG: hypothetical protein IME92_09710 [Proteobacteria bacterium]|nr:hypothetical protein [Pseudomonadota bacterium]